MAGPPSHSASQPISRSDHPGIPGGPTSLRVTMLGSGTSTGVPVIGCRCPVCTSTHPRNRRWRPGLKLETERGVVLVDTPTDLREQALRFGLPRLDAVVYTHPHADHIFGLDDIRIFNFRQRTAIPCYGSAATLAAIRRTFAYVFEETQEGGGKPQLDLVEVKAPFRVLDLDIVPVPVWHGDMEVLGYRIGSFAYVTDCSVIPESSYRLLEGVQTLILDALRYRPHSTHFSVEEAIEAAAKIGARRTVLTHLAHEVDYAAPAVPLPEGVEFGYDGLAFEVPLAVAVDAVGAAGAAGGHHREHRGEREGGDGDEGRDRRQGREDDHECEEGVLEPAPGTADAG